MRLKELNKAGRQWKKMHLKVFIYNLKVLKDFKKVLPYHFKKFIEENNGMYNENEIEGMIYVDNIAFYFTLKNGKIALGSNVDYYIDNVGRNICMT